MMFGFSLDSQTGLEMVFFRRAASSGQAFFCNMAVENPRFYPEEYQWIGLREILQENPIFSGTIHGFL